MSKRRFAAIVAAAAIFTTAAPATALAAPALPPLPAPLAGLQDVLGVHSNPDNKTKNCQVDWNSSATKKELDGTIENTINGGVTPARGDNGVTEVQLWGDNLTSPNWRVVVATDQDVKDYKLVVDLPAGYDYTQTVTPTDSNWFGVDELDNRKEPVKWTNPLGPDDLNIARDGTKVTVTLKGGTLKALDRFSITWNGSNRATDATTLTTKARSTGVLTQCGGNGSLPNLF